jgi:maltooligosyltrehalose trehalohydrolase
MLGDRLANQVSFEDLKLAASATLLSPFIPLLFMGEDYGETAPFQYFISHSDENLIEAVRRGRRREFAEFAWKGDVPDPQSEAAFSSCILNRHLKSEAPHKVLRAYYRELIRLRKKLLSMGLLRKEVQEVIEYTAESVIGLQYRYGSNEAAVFLNFSEDIAHIPLKKSLDRWEKAIDSSDEVWGGKASTAIGKTKPRDKDALSICGRSSVVFLAKE